MSSSPSTGTTFTGYQKLVVFILAITQFTVILDFMVMSPLGDILMKSLQLTPSRFGMVVSAYAISAGISGLLTATFADRFDRKKLLLFFYVGFIVGTFLCGLSSSFITLLAARIITGIFGGVIASISMAIITDLFALQQRGRVIGVVQMGFGASQALGIPIGLYLANLNGWEFPFLVIALFSSAIALLIFLKLKPVNEHLSIPHSGSAFDHMFKALDNKVYRMGFFSTAFISLGGFMMMPFASAFAVNNLEITQEQLPVLFMVSGICSLFLMPFIGRLSDRVNKAKLFAAASVWMMVMVVIYTHMAALPLWLVVLLNVLLMIGIMSRFVPATALTSALPEMADRGAFMSINSSTQQISGGIASIVAGAVIVQKDNFSPLVNYDVVGYLVVLLSCFGVYLLFRVAQVVEAKTMQTTTVHVSETAEKADAPAETTKTTEQA